MNRKSKFEPRQLAKIAGLSEQFLLDAAVLIFVFPVLDTAIQFGKNAITLRLLSWTLALSGVFFILALIIGVVSAKKYEQ